MITNLTVRLGATGAAATTAAITSVGTASAQAATGVAGIGTAAAAASTGLADLAMAGTPIGQIVGGLQGIGSGSVLAGLSAVGSGIGAIASQALAAADALWGLAQAGNASNQVEDAFARLGGTADQMAALREATGNLVDDTSLQQVANKAQQAGIGFDELIAVMGRAPGVAMIAGVDTKRAMETILKSVTNLNTEGFKELGFKVEDTSKAFAAFAKNAGVSVDSLTDAQKRAIFTEQLLSQTVEAGALSEEARANAIGQTQATFTNLQSTLEQTAARALTASGALDGIQAVAGMMAEVMMEVGPALAPVIGGLGQIGSSLMGAVVPALRVVATGLELVTPLLELAGMAVGGVAEVAGGLLSVLAELATLILGPVASAFSGLATGVKFAFETIGKIGSSVGSLFDPRPVEGYAAAIATQIDRIRELATANTDLATATEQASQRRLLTLAAEIEGQTSLRALLELPEIQLKATATAGQEATDAIGLLRDAYTEAGDAAELGVTSVVLLQDAVRKTGAEGEAAAETFGTLALEQIRGLDELSVGIVDVRAEFNQIAADQLVFGQQALSQDEMIGEAVMRVAAARGIDAQLLADSVVFGEQSLALAREELLLATKTADVGEFMTQQQKDRARVKALRAPTAPRARASGGADGAEKIIYEASLIGLDEIDRKLSAVQRRLSENLKAAGRNAEAVVAAHEIAASESSTLHAARIGQITRELAAERTLAGERQAGWDSLVFSATNAMNIAQRLGSSLTEGVTATFAEASPADEIQRLTDGIYAAAAAVTETQPVWQEFASQLSQDLSPAAAEAVNAIDTVGAMVSASAAALQAGQGMSGAALAAAQQFTLGFIKNQKAQATILGMIEVAKAASSVADLNFIGSGLHLAAAAKYFIVAGSKSAPTAPSAPAATAQRQQSEGQGAARAPRETSQPINQYYFSSLDRRPPGVIVADALNETAKKNRGTRLSGSLVSDDAYIGGM